MSKNNRRPTLRRCSARSLRCKSVSVIGSAVVGGGRKCEGTCRLDEEFWPYDVEGRCVLEDDDGNCEGVVLNVRSRGVFVTSRGRENGCACSEEPIPGARVKGVVTSSLKSESLAELIERCIVDLDGALLYLPKLLGAERSVGEVLVRGDGGTTIESGRRKTCKVICRIASEVCCNQPIVTINS